MASIIRARTSAGITKTLRCDSNGVLESTLTAPGLPAALGPLVGAESTSVVAASDGFSANCTIVGAGSLATQATLSALNGKIPSIGQHDMTGSLSVVLASDQPLMNTSSNLAVADAIGAGASTASMTTAGYKRFSLLGSSSAATTLTVEVSANGGTTWWTTDITLAAVGGDHYYLTWEGAHPTTRIKSSAAVTLTAILCCCS